VAQPMVAHVSWLSLHRGLLCAFSFAAAEVPLCPLRWHFCRFWIMRSSPPLCAPGLRALLGQLWGRDFPPAASHQRRDFTGQR
jgi:hypothetical protein